MSEEKKEYSKKDTDAEKMSKLIEESTVGKLKILIDSAKREIHGHGRGTLFKQSQPGTEEIVRKKEKLFLELRKKLLAREGVRAVGGGALMDLEDIEEVSSVTNEKLYTQQHRELMEAQLNNLLAYLKKAVAENMLMIKEGKLELSTEQLSQLWRLDNTIHDFEVAAQSSKPLMENTSRNLVQNINLFNSMIKEQEHSIRSIHNKMTTLVRMAMNANNTELPMAVKLENIIPDDILVDAKKEVEGSFTKDMPAASKLARGLRGG